MVVRDDYVQAQRAGVRDFVHGANAAVHRDQQISLARDQRNGFRVEPVALIHAIGNVRAHLRAGRLQGGYEQRRGAYAVRVKIAVDAESLAALDGAHHPFHSRGHVAQAEGILHHRIVFGEKRAHLRRAAHAPVVEYLEQQRMFRQQVQEPIRGRF